MTSTELVTNPGLEEEPAKIVSGFGGTLNLVLGMGYTVTAMLAFASLFHLRSTGYFTEPVFLRLLIGASVALAGGTIAGVGLPLRLGRASLERQEF